MASWSFTPEAVEQFLPLGIRMLADARLGPEKLLCCYIDSGHRVGWFQLTSASFVLGLQRIAIALLRNIEIGHRT